MITIDQASVGAYGNVTTQTIQHSVLSADQVLVVTMNYDSTAAATSITFNGDNLTKVVETSLLSGGTAGASIWYLKNPPVGQYDLTVIVPDTGGFSIVAFSISGVDKKTTNLIFKSATGVSAAPLVSLQVPTANSLIIDRVEDTSAGLSPNAAQKQTIGGAGTSFKFANPGLQSMSWTLSASDTWAYAAVVLKPANAPSLWNPTTQQRNIQDVIQGDQTGIPSPSSLGYKTASFYNNSFLHTVGRLFVPPTPPQLISEIERPTSQIIIDRVYQGQSGGGQTLTLQINVPSQEADVIVTGGSVIATGGAWQSVTLSGTSLTKLIQAGIAGQSAEIWWTPRPGVGSQTISIVPTATTGQVYANVLVVYGLDNKNQNIITASATDAAATTLLTASITPDVSNSLLIDAFTTIDATASPIPDSLQTPVFNATAINTSEYVFSTYKLSSSGNQMNYNLTAAVNASLVVACFRPANAASMWFPNIDNRTLNDVVTASGLDSGKSPAFGQYGYKSSSFYLNSFLHTIGRLNFFPVTSLFTWQQLVDSTSSMPREYFEKPEVVAY